MNLIRYRHPHSLLSELHRELLPLMGLDEEDAWTLKVDMKEEEHEFVVFADIPGVDLNDIEIQMDGNTLTVKGERKTEKEEKGKNYYRLERSAGKFYRQFTLPESVDSQHITAKTKNGVLAIHLPKAKEHKSNRKINIQQEKE